MLPQQSSSDAISLDETPLPLGGGFIEWRDHDDDDDRMLVGDADGQSSKEEGSSYVLQSTPLSDQMAEGSGESNHTPPPPPPPRVPPSVHTSGPVSRNLSSTNSPSSLPQKSVGRDSEGGSSLPVVSSAGNSSRLYKSIGASSCLGGVSPGSSGVGSGGVEGMEPQEGPLKHKPARNSKPSSSASASSSLISTSPSTSSASAPASVERPRDKATSPHVSSTGVTQDRVITFDLDTLKARMAHLQVSEGHTAPGHSHKQEGSTPSGCHEGEDSTPSGDEGVKSRFRAKIEPRSNAAAEEELRKEIK